MELFYSIHPNKVKGIAKIRAMFKGKSGLEIGGPSRRFTWKGIIPLYNIIDFVDGCNFSNHTIWEGNISADDSYRYKSRVLGKQHIADATDLTSISDGSYEFVLSSHSLEHIANPLKALTEWIRVLKPGGLVLLIVPNKNYCFDHRRPTTTFSHLLEDYQANIGEDDMTHFEEVLELHDLEMDKPLGSKEDLKARLESNFENRAMHHHVFDLNLLREVFSYFGIEEVYHQDGEDIVIIGKTEG